MAKQPMFPQNTFVIPIIRPDLIGKCLEKLYKHTPHNFYVYVVDCTKNGIQDKEILDKIHLLIRPYRNLGFAKNCNIAIKNVETEYFTLYNDDVEAINNRWWDGILRTFKKRDNIVGVSASSIRLPDWSLGRPAGDDLDLLHYKEEYTQEDYDFLLNEPHYASKSLTIQPGSIIDGCTFYCTTFPTKDFKKISYLNEKFYPGGGEDMDWNARSYRSGKKKHTIVGTTLSWVFHHWSKSMNMKVQEEMGLVDDPLRWNNNAEIWGEGFELWGDDRPVPPITKIPL